MAAAGQGVKATVEYVCNLLASLGAPLLSPEVLRQAKFNAPAAVSCHVLKNLRFGLE